MLQIALKVVKRLFTYMGRIISNYTFRLFKELPSFSGGMASMLDFSDFDRSYNYDKNEKEADLNSIHADWLAIGDDLRKTIDEYNTDIRKRIESLKK